MSITYDDLKRCAALAREADDLRERMIRLCAAQGAGKRPDETSGGRIGDPVGEAAVKLDKLRARWMRTIDQYLTLMLRADEAIAGLESPEVRTVLRLRLDGLTWRRVAAKTHYSESWCKSLHAAGMKALTRVGSPAYTED